MLSVKQSGKWILFKPGKSGDSGFKLESNKQRTYCTTKKSGDISNSTSTFVVEPVFFNQNLI